jgi:uncharacterized membrane protein (UPF0127 family)
MLRLYNLIANSRRFNKYKAASVVSVASIISLSAYYVFYKNQGRNRYPEIKLEKLNNDVIADDVIAAAVEDVIATADDDIANENYVFADDESMDSMDSIEEFRPYDKRWIFCHYYNTPQSIENGLKHIKTMPLLEVGLFDMGYLNNHTLWMRDTYIPLDIIFINNHNIIVDKIENTSPLSDESLFVNKLSYYIIEANAGFYKKFSLKIGMNINEVFSLIMII